ncbi:hypothetical protein Y032_0006g2805 [Ancylostoma ceylanicum]|uniref:Uncharacterized protein n=1 Tax=Ancylostoma ceylanicum TaxID=53326 RepID=A0A016VQ29_9BILA|nr:hypothetical protein Y032_0006g2805 [Ancylostoma ceylanicum]
MGAFFSLFYEEGQVNFTRACTLSTVSPLNSRYFQVEEERKLPPDEETEAKSSGGIHEGSRESSTLPADREWTSSPSKKLYIWSFLALFVIFNLDSPLGGVFSFFAQTTRPI